MNIALMAHKGKNELMVQFCVAYCGIMAGHSICATNTVGRLVGDATGLDISLYMDSEQGGCQQIGARIAYNEIDLVLFFCDPALGGNYYETVMNTARLCDQHNVPFATNAATAEVLIHGLKRGDLDWRDIVNPKD